MFQATRPAGSAIGSPRRSRSAPVTRCDRRVGLDDPGRSSATRSTPSAADDAGAAPGRPHRRPRGRSTTRRAAVDLGRLVRAPGPRGPSSRRPARRARRPARRPAPRRAGPSARSASAADAARPARRSRRSASLPSSPRPRCRPRRSSRTRRPRRAGRRSRNALELGDVVLGLAGEADDDVGPDAGLRRERADLVEQVEERARCRRSGASGAAAARWRAGRTGRSTARRPASVAMASISVGPHLGRLQVGDPHPVDAVDGGQLAAAASRAARRSPRSLP